MYEYLADMRHSQPATYNRVETGDGLFGARDVQYLAASTAPYISFNISLNVFWWFGVTTSELRRVGPADIGLRTAGSADMDCRLDGPLWFLSSSTEIPSISHSSFCAWTIARRSDDGESATK